jgi:amino acid permease
MKCPRCGGTNVLVQAVTEVNTKHRGFLGWLLWILLACCTFGLILIIPLITNSKTRSRTFTEAVCQTCGNRWRI